MSKSKLSEFEKKVTTLRLNSKCWGEIKWNKVRSMSNDMLSFYKFFIDLAFDDIPVCFRFVVVEKSLLNLKKYHENSIELVRLKFLHLLISRYADKFLDGKTKKGLHIVIDEFEESRQAKEEHWQQKTRKYTESHLECPIEHMQPCNSHICSLVQLCDLFTGATSYSWNTPESKRRLQKNELANYIERKTGKKLDSVTLPTEKEFNMWRWKPSPFKQTFL
ncbi:MAG: DUF3800 domain-containing protein [Patescibacteria group bacterium]|nr:DUF3800 domain-containing protein [Patescibacteria group bacterium]